MRTRQRARNCENLGAEWDHRRVLLVNAYRLLTVTLGPSFKPFAGGAPWSEFRFPSRSSISPRRAQSRCGSSPNATSRSSGCPTRQAARSCRARGARRTIFAASASACCRFRPATARWPGCWSAAAAAPIRRISRRCSVPRWPNGCRPARFASPASWDRSRRPRSRWVSGSAATATRAIARVLRHPRRRCAGRGRPTGPTCDARSPPTGWRAT